MALYMVVENFRNGDALPVYFEVHPVMISKEAAEKIAAAVE